jgi:16S rRNA (guanine527-N7)-methyltransferase
VGELIDVLERARKLGFLGPGPVEAHIAHAEGFAAAFAAAEPPGLVADLGSGGGVPGLVLAGLWGMCRFALIDANERRTAFLGDAVGGLGVADRVIVVRERAEVVGRVDEHRGLYDAVVARGFGPPPVTAECAAPLLRVGGLLVVSEPPDDVARWDEVGLAQVGMVVGPVVGEGPRYQVLRQSALCPGRYPRRVGIPTKRPLW